MPENIYSGLERRRFQRFEYVKPLAYKICKQETISKLLEGYTSNVSQAGVLCSIKEKVSPGDILWLSFDKGTLGVCVEIENHSWVYQNGVIGKVVRIEYKNPQAYEVGVQFLTREEKNDTNIYPQVHFLK